MRGEDDTTFYAVADFGENCVFGAQTFVGILDTADEMSFNAAPTTTHALHYAVGTDLAHGNTGTVGGVLFKIIGTPEQISGRDMRAHLVRVPE